MKKTDMILALVAIIAAAAISANDKTDLTVDAILGDKDYKAMQQIIELRDSIETLNSDIQRRDEEASHLREQVEQLRTINQQYYLRISQGSEPSEPEPQKPKSLEDFAKENMKGVIK